MSFITRSKFLKIIRLLLASVIGIIVLVLIFYNFVFESYEVIGESVQCKTNTPFALNYSCKLDIIDNNTQYWSFESNIPEGFILPHMMVRVILEFKNKHIWVRVSEMNAIPLKMMIKQSTGQISMNFIQFELFAEI